MVNREDTDDKGAIVKNISFSIGNISCKRDLDTVINDKEDLDLFYDTKHCGNSSVSSATAILSSSPPAFDSKTIIQADSPTMWSDVVAGRKRYSHQSESQVNRAPLYNIPTIINGQVLKTD